MARIKETVEMFHPDLQVTVTVAESAARHKERHGWQRMDGASAPNSNASSETLDVVEWTQGENAPAENLEE